MALVTLSENSEYDEAKNEQGFIESRIAQLEAMLKRTRVLAEDEISDDKVMMGCIVKVEDEDGEVEEYTITSSTEADPANGKLSDEALLVPPFWENPQEMWQISHCPMEL